MSYTSNSNPARKIVGLALLGVLAIVVLFGIGNLVEVVGADESVGIQSPLTGKITWHTSQGPKWQGFGKLYRLPKRASYEFHAPKEQGDPDRRIGVQFNDSGRGFIDGLIQFEYPTDEQNLNLIITKFGSHESVLRQVLEPTVTKSVYFTGPLMSSKESYAEKKNAFAEYVEDQVENGIYATTTVTTSVQDILTGEKRDTAALVIVEKNGVKQRQEKGQLTAFGIRPFGLAIRGIDYDDTVDKQIAEQQRITMAVQTSKAEALQAQQKLITTEAQGQANAAQAKWEQEKVKAAAIVVAQQNRDVEVLNVETARAYKEAILLRASADAGARRQLMEADGALEQKLKAQVTMNKDKWDAISRYPGALVPQFQLGGSGSGQGQSLIGDLLTATLAKQLTDTAKD